MNEGNTITAGTILKRYIILVVIVSVLGFCWAISPSAIGLYVVWFIFYPINSLLILAGIIRVILFQRKKADINYLIYYAAVIIVPIISALLLQLIITTFGNNRGC